MLCGGCAGTEEYYRNTREAVLVKQSSKGALGTAEYYRSNREAVLVQMSTIVAPGRLC